MENEIWKIALGRIAKNMKLLTFSFIGSMFDDINDTKFICHHEKGYFIKNRYIVDRVFRGRIDLGNNIYIFYLFKKC